MNDGVHLPVSKSFLHENAISDILETAYGLSSVQCQLITAYMRDVYLVTSRENRYIFYIYRANQRALSEIRDEWRFVDYLDANGVPVAPAIATNNGEHVLPVSAPEGRRFGVLTTFIEGRDLRKKSGAGAVRAYGRLVAKIHLLADVMPLDLVRPVNDVGIIVNQSISSVEAAVLDRPEDIVYLNECAARLLPIVETVPKEAPYYGLIHGDVIRGNALVGENGLVAVLDFDLCGLGWRVYDVASYLVVIRGLPEEPELERAFLTGYQEVRTLAEIEREVMPVFEAIRAIFAIGIPAMNVYHWGKAYLDAVLDFYLQRLKDSMHRINTKM